MGNCLVTKLKGSVNDTSILRLGELRVHFNKVSAPTGATQGINVGFDEECSLEVLGNEEAYFTNVTLAENKGEKISAPVGTMDIVVSNNDCDVAILNKYAITSFETTNYNYTTSAESKSININDFKYSKRLTRLDVTRMQASGDIESMKDLTNLTIFRVYGCRNITGDIANLKNLTSLTNITLNSVPVTGDIANISGMTGLTALDIANTKVTGNIEVLKNMTKLRSLNIEGLSGLSGNLGIIPDRVKRIVSINTTSKFTWTSTNKKKCFACDGLYCDNIDQMLIDMSGMEAQFESENSWDKIIRLFGTRTSASDAAVATLEGKGYTVIVG